QELLILRNEVGLADELNHRGCALALSHGDQTLAGLTALTLRDTLQTLETQDLNGLLHVAVRLDQGGLAVHHAGAKAVAQLLDCSHAYCSHSLLLKECLVWLLAYSAAGSAAASAAGASSADSAAGASAAASVAAAWSAPSSSTSHSA